VDGALATSESENLIADFRQANFSAVFFRNAYINSVSNLYYKVAPPVENGAILCYKLDKDRLNTFVQENNVEVCQKSCKLV